MATLGLAACSPNLDPGLTPDSGAMGDAAPTDGAVGDAGRADGAVGDARPTAAQDAGGPSSSFEWTATLGPDGARAAFLPISVDRIDADGTTVLVGGTYVPTGEPLVWMALRDARDGRAVPTFGIDGELTRPDVAGRPLIAASSSATFDLYTARVGGPQLVTVVERIRRVDAVVVSTFAIDAGSPLGLARRGDDLYLLSDTTMGSRLHRRDARDLAFDPSFVAVFASAGEPGLGVVRLAVDDAYAHVSWGYRRWTLERRAVIDPAASSSLSGTGSSIGFVVDGGAYLIAAFDEASNTSRIERRAADGAPDLAFGAGSGTVSWSGDGLHGIALDGGRLYAFGRATERATTHLRIEARSPTTGALDPSFASGGVWMFEADGAVTALGFDATGIYAGALVRGTGALLEARLTKVAR